MDLDLRVLRYFVAVADTGTYTAAAAALHIATPSLSQQIRRLEHDVGVRLFDRDHRGARLTTAGIEVLGHARELLAGQERTLAVGRRYRRAESRTLRIGFLAAMAGIRTRTLLDDVRRAAPSDARIELVQVHWADQVTAVLDGRVDAVLARPPLPEAPVRRVCLLSEPRVLVMAADHPLARLAELRVADLAGLLQVDTDGVDEAWRSFWTLDPRPDGSTPRYGPLVHSVEEMLEVCAGTSAVGITAASVVDLYPRPDLAFRQIIDIAPSTVELMWVDGTPSRLLATLLESAKALVATARQGESS